MSSGAPKGRDDAQEGAENAAEIPAAVDIASSVVIKSARMQRTLTREALSKATKGPTGDGPGGYVPLRTLERIEKGESSPTMRQFTSLCEALKIRGSVLLTRIEELTVYLEGLPERPASTEEYEVVATTWLLNR